MQATGTRRFVRNRTAGVAAAIAFVVLAVAAVGALALNTALDGGESSVNSPVIAQGTIQFDQMRFMEENTWQIPYTAPLVLSFDEVAFIEANTFQIPYVVPVLSHENIRFIEDNTLGYHAPSADYQMYGEAHVLQTGCSPEPIERAQHECAEY